MEKRLDRIAAVLTCLLISLLILTVFFFITGCSGDKEALKDPRVALFNSLKGDWMIESVELDNQELQGFQEFSIKFEETSTPFVYQYQCTNRPELSPWKVEGIWEFGGSVEMEMTRDADTEDELDIIYSLDNNQLIISFSFTGDGYNARSANGNWIFILSKQ